MEIALSIVADSRRAASEGLPALVELLGRREIPATFFLSCGPAAPDIVPRALREATGEKPGIFGRLFRRAVPADDSPLASLLEPLAGKLVAAGHEIGFRPWGVAGWAGALAGPGDEALRESFLAGAQAVEVLTGETAGPFAAPQWRVSPALLELEQERGLRWASDTRGSGPFLPTLAGKRYRTLQVPTTLPTWDEVIGSPGLDDDSLLAFYRSSVREGIAQVHRLHAEIEGVTHLALFERLLDGWLEDRIRFVTLGTVARRTTSRKDTLKIKAIRDREIPGHDGPVACEA